MGVRHIKNRLHPVSDMAALNPISAGRGERIHLDPLVEDPRRWLRDEFAWDEAISVVDIFSGAGGMSFGLDSSEGLRVTAAFERDEDACETHRGNMPAPVVKADLRQVDDFHTVLSEEGVRRIDAIVGGPPCKGFSRLGKGALRKIALENGRLEATDDRKCRSAQDDRNWMFRHFMRAVRQLEPRVVVIENVPEMLDHTPVIEELLEVFDELDYHSETRVLHAERYGVPQRRRRLFIIAAKQATKIPWPTPSWVRRTVRDAIGDLPVIEAGHMVEQLPWSRPQPCGPYLREMRKGIRGKEARVVRAHVTRVHRPEDIEAFGYMSEGDKYAAVPERLRRYRDDIFKDKYHRMIWDEPSWTVTAHLAKDGYKYIHPDQCRTISVREAARLQSFPDRFRFAGPRTSRFRQIGNAVPPLLGRAIAETIRQLVR